jgi:hypothetical protein
MPLGPGKYDALATLVRERTEAAAVVVIVLDGNKGSGFACQADMSAVPALDQYLPNLLENVARQMREEMREAVSAREAES